MDNIDPDQYETVAEELVFEYLQNQGEVPKWVKPAPGNIGDIKVGDRIIEVKGQTEDWNATGEEDRVRNSIKISKAEFDFMEKNPKLFDVYVVYRLKHNENPEYNKPKIAICKGVELVKIPPKIREVHISTSYEFWKETEQITLNKITHTPLKNPRKKNRSEV